MAKSIRSKVKRKNRSQLRKVLTEPMMRRRQEAIANAIKRDKEEKHGGTINALSKLLPKSTPQVTSSSTMTADDAEHVEEEVENPQISRKRLHIIRSNRPKGSKPKNNPGKPLVWFK